LRGAALFPAGVQPQTPQRLSGPLALRAQPGTSFFSFLSSPKPAEVYFKFCPKIKISYV